MQDVHVVAPACGATWPKGHGTQTLAVASSRVPAGHGSAPVKMVELVGCVTSSDKAGTALSTGSLDAAMWAAKVWVKVARELKAAATAEAWTVPVAATVKFASSATAVSRLPPDVVMSATEVTATYSKVEFREAAMELVSVTFCAAPKEPALTPTMVRLLLNVVCGVLTRPGGFRMHVNWPGVDVYEPVGHRSQRSCVVVAF